MIYFKCSDLNWVLNTLLDSDPGYMELDLSFDLDFKYDIKVTIKQHLLILVLVMPGACVVVLAVSADFYLDDFLIWLSLLHFWSFLRLLLARFTRLVVSGF